MPRTVHILNKLGWLLPFLIGVLLVVGKFSENANRLPWSQLQQALLFSMIVSVVSLGVFYAIPLTRRVVGLVSGIFVLITMLWMLFPWPVMSVGVILLAVVFLPKVKHKEHVTALSVLIIGMACLVALGMAIVNSTHPPVTASHGIVELKSKPDIYFIVPDRFCGHAGLLEMGYDNSDFMEYLRNKGFYVGDRLSHDQLDQTDTDSSTTRTTRFMASVLNLGVEVDLNIPYNVASQMIKHNKLVSILKDNGYAYYHIGDWWPETEASPLADVNYIYEGGSFLPSEELSMTLVDRSIYRYLTTFFFGNINRERHMYQLESFKDAAAQPEPKFVMLHTLLPHPPFVWAANGTAQEDDTLTIDEKYIEQVKFAETYLTECIEAVGDGILIIQSDEGICYTTRSLNYDLTDNEWRGVLTAWRIPGDDSGLIELETTEILGHIVDMLRA